MPSNPTLPEDVRAEWITVIEDAVARHCEPHDGYPDMDDILDSIAPLIIEWAQKDALLSAADDMPGGGRTSQYWDGERVEYATYEVHPHKRGPADWLRERAQFTPDESGIRVLRGVVQRSAVTNRYIIPETTGGTTNG